MLLIAIVHSLITGAAERAKLEEVAAHVKSGAFGDVGRNIFFPHANANELATKTKSQLDRQLYENYANIKKEALRNQPFFGEKGWTNQQLVDSQKLKGYLREQSVFGKPFAQKPLVKILKQVAIPAALIGTGYYLGNIFTKNPQYKAALQDDSKGLMPDSPISGLTPLPSDPAHQQPTTAPTTPPLPQQNIPKPTAPPAGQSQMPSNFPQPPSH